MATVKASDRRHLRRAIAASTKKCSACWTPCRYWDLVKGVPTCPTCACTRPVGGVL